MLKRLILSFLAIPSKLHNAFMLRYKKVEFTNKPKIRGKLRVYGRGRIILGKNVEINSSLGSNPIGGDTQAIFSVGHGAVLTIGDDTGISNATIFCKEKVTLGSNVKIGGSVKIYDSDFHALDFLERRNPETDITKLAAVTIGDDCFIGAHSIILKGVEIGARSIIGAGSVVTRSIPEGEIWGGNPAKHIRKI